MPPTRGLPPRIYLPIVLILGALFLSAMYYLLSIGFGVRGSVFGTGSAPVRVAAPESPENTNVQGGGPPAAVMTQLKALRDRIAAHPNDDVALTQLGDMYLAVGKYREAIPFYERALKVNPGNVAAQTGLEQAKSGLAQSQ